jgi:MOSC domain-containing protein
VGLELAEVVGRLVALNRFPVEPLAGESPNTVLLASGGFVGDRVHEIRNSADDSLLVPSLSGETPSFGARYLEDLVAEDLDRWTRVRTPSGKEYAMTDPDWLVQLSRAVGSPLILSRRTKETNPLRLVSRQTLRLAERTYGAPIEPYRLRANLVVDISEGKAFDEDQWMGHHIRIGEALLEVAEFAPDSLETRPLELEGSEGDADLLAGLVQIHGGHLGVAARVLQGQRLRAGDPVVLVD